MALKHYKVYVSAGFRLQLEQDIVATSHFDAVQRRVLREDPASTVGRHYGAREVCSSEMMVLEVKADGTLCFTEESVD